ncbi:MAG TPA: CHAT domain-containing protein [Frankiaceae bacterium]|nr:CHAT domain-containing protein [Frankiaceae bacterium]
MITLDVQLLRRVSGALEPVDHAEEGDLLVARVTSTCDVSLTVEIAGMTAGETFTVLGTGTVEPGATADIVADTPVAADATRVLVDATAPDGTAHTSVYDVWRLTYSMAEPPADEPFIGLPRALPEAMASGTWVPGGIVTGGGGADDSATFTAYGRLAAPDVVPADEVFDVTLGLAAAPDEGRVATAMSLPDPESGPYPVTVVLSALGCEIREGARHDLLVTAEDPYPEVTLHVTAPTGEHSLVAMYAVGGVTVGMTQRSVRATATPAAATDSATPVAASVAVTAPPPGYPVADLEIVVLDDPDGPAGGLVWHASSPHASVTPVDGLRSSVGSTPREFATKLVRLVDGASAAVVEQRLKGIGREVAREIPEPVRDAVRQAAAAAGGPPTVLLLTAEEYVPWELAVLEPPIDPALPPYLGVQAAVGRWVPKPNAPRPALPPPAHVLVRSVTVVTADYDHPSWTPLPGALAEGEALARRFSATSVQAASPAVWTELKRSPGADVLHFALHGKYDPTADEFGIVLADATFLTPYDVRGCDLPAAPFVFLNACQVGSGAEELGDSAGIPDAFLTAGAAAVIAPLWSVDDTIAGGIAERLYDEALGGETVGEVVRRTRATFLADPATPNRTALAYQLFGHPCLTLTRED